MADIVVFGAGQLADVIRVYVDTHGPDRIVGFTADREYVHETTFAGRPLVPWEELEKTFPPDKVKLLGPISYRKLNDFRTARYQEGKKRGYSYTSFVHPGSHVYAESIGENCFIMDGNTIQPLVKIGNNVVIWTGNHIGHHTVIKDNNYITSHNAIASNVTIGENCYMAGQLTIDYGVTIGDRCFLGIGNIVRKNVPAESVIPPVKTSNIAKYSSQRIKRLL